MSPKPREIKSAAPSPSPARSMRSRQATEEVPEVPEGGDEPEGEDDPRPSTSDRMAKLKELRLRMNESTAANRRDLVEDHQKSKVTARELQRLEKQKKLAQTLRLKADAEASGEDLERRKAWEWSIEQNERWEAKVQDQKERADNRYKGGWGSVAR